jgi:hypothetical protein
MITNDGKNILAKYLIGQAPAYASYIAVGCGPKALDRDLDPFGDYSLKQSLDFEVFRSQIVSRGYVNEDGVAKVVLTAELPSEERYEITEVGVFSAGANPSAGALDSRSLFSFSQSENWEYHTESLAVAIPVVYTPLDGSNNDNNIIGEYDLNNDGTPEEYPVFQSNADNRVFTAADRVARNERTRFLNNFILMRGDTSDLSEDQSGRIVFNSGAHIHLNGIDVRPFDRQAPTDEIRLAFSVISKDADSEDQPNKVLILVEFASGEGQNAEEFESAKFEVILENGTGPGQQDFENNRYIVVSKQLQELIKSPGFAWSTMNIAKIYVCVLDDQDNPSDEFYVGLDASRLENVTTKNPLYGMTGYSVVKTLDAKPIVKIANTTNYIEFRFGIGTD